MNVAASISRADNLFIGQIGWRYYNKIKKKAMEQEFSWSGLLLSMSIAFFIVIAGAYALNLLHASLEKAEILKTNRTNLYLLENTSGSQAENYLQTELLSEKLENICSFTFVA